MHLLNKPVIYNSVIQYAGSAEGTFDFAMSLYKTVDFASAYNQGDPISVGNTVYAKVDFESASADLNMFVQNCYAAPTQNASSATHYSLIKEGGWVPWKQVSKTKML